MVSQFLVAISKRMEIHTILISEANASFSFETIQATSKFNCYCILLVRTQTIQQRLSPRISTTNNLVSSWYIWHRGQSIITSYDPLCWSQTSQISSISKLFFSRIKTFNCLFDLEDSGCMGDRAPNHTTSYSTNQHILSNVTCILLIQNWGLESSSLYCNFKCSGLQSCLPISGTDCFDSTRLNSTESSTGLCNVSSSETSQCLNIGSQQTSNTRQVSTNHTSLRCQAQCFLSGLQQLNTTKSRNQTRHQEASSINCRFILIIILAQIIIQRCNPSTSIILFGISTKPITNSHCRVIKAVSTTEDGGCDKLASIVKPSTPSVGISNSKITIPIIVAICRILVSGHLVSLVSARLSIIKNTIIDIRHCRPLLFIN